MKIEYIGRQNRHRERLYGTKAVFNGKGAIVEVDDKIGLKMVTKHPDQYAEAVNTQKAVTILDEPVTPTQVTPIEADEIIINGNVVKIAQASKDVLIEAAKKYWNAKLNPRLSKDEIVTEVISLIAERGQPQ